jgi:hypothetical protein
MYIYMEEMIDKVQLNQLSKETNKQKLESYMLSTKTKDYLLWHIHIKINKHPFNSNIG